MFTGKAQHRKVMRALKEESTDQDVLLKKKYKQIIEDNVKSGLYSMEYILEHKLYLPEPPAIMDSSLKAPGQIQTLGKDTEGYDVRDQRAHLTRNAEKMEKLRENAGNFLLDDDVLLFNSLKSGEKIRMVDETPLFNPITKPKYSQFQIGCKGDEKQLGPFVANINKRADEIIKLQPPMRSSYRLEPELDKELNARKEEKRQLIAKSEEATQQHLHFAELQALSQKAEDLLIKPTYMPPKPNLGVPQNPFAKRDSNENKKCKVVRDEEIEELLLASEEKMALIRSNPKDFVRKPRTKMVTEGDSEDAKIMWYTERINNRFSAEGKRLTKFQRNLKSVQRSVDDDVVDYANKSTFLSLGNGLTYEKEDKIHPESFDRVTKELVAKMSRDRLWTDVCDTSKGTLKSAFMDQKIWAEEKEKRDKAAFYEAGVIPGKPKLQENASAADKIVDDYLKGRLRL